MKRSKKPFYFAVAIVYCVCASEAYCVDLLSGASASIIYEEGPHTIALSPTLALKAGAEMSLGPGRAFADMAVFSGAFVGETIGASLGAGYSPDFKGPWRPRIGLTAAIDFGSRLVTMTEPAALTPSPLCYAGARISPLRFEAGDCVVSALDASLSIAMAQGPATLRYEISLLSLEKKFADVFPKTPPTASDREKGMRVPVSVNMNYGLAYTLFQSLPGGLSYMSFEAGISTGGLELEAGFISLAPSLEYFLEDWLVSLCLSYSPKIGLWHPAIGLGWLYANPGFTYNGYYLHSLDRSDISAFYLGLKPLRLAFRLGDGWRIALSCLELRYSPIFPTAMLEFNEPSTALVSVDPIRVGLSFDL